MSEEIDKHVLRKYEVQQRLGKGVSAAPPPPLLPAAARSWWWQPDLGKEVQLLQARRYGLLLMCQGCQYAANQHGIAAGALRLTPPATCRGLSSVAGLRHCLEGR